MAKRIMAMMLALAMVLSLAPTVVLADGEQEITRSPKAGSHTVAGHSDECSAHCGNGVSWTAWDGDVTKLAAGGHYYLTADTTLTKDVEVAADLHLCLNGYVLTAATNKRILSTKGDTAVEVVISDCTAYTQDGKLYAGAITGGIDTSTNTGGGAMFVRRGGQVHLYKIRLLKNTSKANGGVATLQAADSNLAGGKLFATGCEVANNSAISGTSLKEGGAFRMAAGTELNLMNTVLSDNSGSNGGVIRAVGGAVTIDGCTFTGNSGAKGGVFYTTGDATLEISNSTFTDNSATTAGAVMYMGGKTVKIQGQTRITGNECNHKTAGGAVYMGSTSCKLILSGKVYIAENTTPYTEDVVLYYADNDTIYVNGLADGSYVEFSTPATAAPQAKDLVVVEGNQSAWKTGWLAYRDANKDLKYIGRDATGFIFQDNLPAVHTHCVCGVENCTEHRQVTYEAWDGDASKLAAGGKYYLTDDAQLSGQVTVKADLDLCLNGKTLTAASGKRHFSTPENGNVTITISDCEAEVKNGVYEAGKLTGANSAYDGGAIYLHKTNKLYMYDGILRDNTATGAGGAIFVNTNAECHLYGGVIEENEAAGNSGAIHTSASSVLTLKDVTIRNNNTQRYGGAVYVNSTADLTISGNTVISGNTRKTVANNLHMAGQSLIKPVNLGDNASVGVYGGEERAISPDTTDLASKFFSDNSAYKVAYREGKLQLVPAVEHIHCQCGKTNCTDSTHKQIIYKAWDGDASKLAAGGKYFLTADAQLTGQVTVAADLDLCLHGKTLTAASGKRHFSTPENGNVTITITDCEAQVKNGVYEAGKLTGADSAYDGGVIYLHKTNKLYMYGGILSDNTAAKAGGAIFVNTDAECHLYGGVIEENEATGNGGAISTSAGSVLTLKDVTIRNNSTQRYGGAVYVNDTAVLTISGDTVVSGNTRNTTANNLHLGGQSLIRPENLGDNASVGVYGGEERAISPDTTDVASKFFSDNSTYKVAYKDGKLQLVPAVVHIHCQCGKTDCTDSTHKQISYKAWDGDASKLAAGGKYFLTADAQLTGQVTVAADLDLCLHGKTLTAASGKRHFSTPENGNVTITIADCTAQVKDGVYQAGKLTGADSVYDGGAIYLHKTNKLYMYDGILSDNTAEKSGGAIFVDSNAECHLYGGVIENNAAVGNSGAINTSAGSVLTLKDVTIRNNSTQRYGGAVYVNNTAVLTVSGDTVILGNTSKGVINNLHLAGQSLIRPENLSQNAKIGVNAAAFRTISTETKDYAANFLSDNTKLKIVYQDKVLRTDAAADHRHCLCAGSSTVGCDHTATTYIEWDDPTKLPGTGNYFLSVDVVVTSQARVENGTLNLCLNGHTVKVGEKGGRIFYLDEGGILNISDCAGSGKLTGATKAAILANAKSANMQINLYGGSITGNTNVTSGAGIVAQGGCSVNMYGGRITGNSLTASLILDANGKPELDEAGNQACNAANGTALYVAAGNVFNMYGGEISGNTAKEVNYVKADGSTSYAGGSGGAMYIRGIANLYGGKITGNTAKLGGGVMVYGKGAELNLLGTEITGNSASSGGGVISQGSSVINMKSGKVNNNTATGTGAGVYVSTGTTLNMTGGSISGNVAANQENQKNGAGIYMLASTANLTGGIISENKGANGAGVYMSPSGTRYPTLNLGGDVVITGNVATAAGGAISVTGENATITMTGGTISKNTAKNGGGVITQTKSSFTMSGGSITGNNSTGTGGGVYVSTGTTFTMTGGSIDGNKAASDGGGICLLRSTGVFKGGEVSNNTAINHAGIRVNGANVTIHNLKLVGNRAVGKPGEDGKNTGGNAGGLFAGQTTYTTNGVKNIAIPKVTIHNIYAANNFANNAGGAMLIQSKGTTFTMTGGTFANNTANGSGGALYLSTNVAVRISGGSFHGNSAKAAGAINFLGCQAEISNVKFYENTVKSQGGVCVIGRETGNVTMKNVEMYDNTSTGAAGALLLQNYAKLQMENSKFSGNQCETSGGAIYFGNPCYATFKSVEFTENRSVGIGGAIHVHANADVTMDDITVSDNTAEGGYGGGISTRGRLVLSNSKILNNKCLAGEGGGIGTFRANSQYLADDNGVFATNVIISGNESSLQGGGVYGHRGGPVYLENCTITDNTAKGEGGGVYSDGRFSLIDSTVTGNTSGGEGYAVYLTAAEYDGHSYLTGFKKVGGNVIVRDNNGGDMYIGEGTGVAVVGEAIGEKAHIEIKLHSGVLSEHLFGVYGYEGGDLVYTVTAGDRSVTDPEAYQYYQEPADQDADAAGNIGNVVLYIVVGVVAAAVIAALVLVVMKKKKAGTPAEKANKE